MLFNNLIFDVSTLKIILSVKCFVLFICSPALRANRAIQSAKMHLKSTNLLARSQESKYSSVNFTLVFVLSSLVLLINATIRYNHKTFVYIYL